MPVPFASVAPPGASHTSPWKHHRTVDLFGVSVCVVGVVCNRYLNWYSVFGVVGVVGICLFWY